MKKLAITGDPLPPVEPTSGEGSQGWLGALRLYLGTVIAGNLIWEIAQLPLYTIWQTGTFRDAVHLNLKSFGEFPRAAVGS